MCEKSQRFPQTIRSGFAHKVSFEVNSGLSGYDALGFLTLRLTKMQSDRQRQSALDLEYSVAGESILAGETNLTRWRSDPCRQPPLRTAISTGDNHADNIGL